MDFLGHFISSTFSREGVDRCTVYNVHLPLRLCQHVSYFMVDHIKTLTQEFRQPRQGKLSWFVWPDLHSTAAASSLQRQCNRLCWAFIHLTILQQKNDLCCHGHKTDQEQQYVMSSPLHTWYLNMSVNKSNALENKLIYDTKANKIYTIYQDKKKALPWQTFWNKLIRCPASRSCP